MPKLIDYVARFAVLQDAVVQVVLSHGVHALSRRSVARTLGVSASTVHRLVARDADLVMLAVEEVEARRRYALRWAPRNESTRDRVLRTIQDLVPGSAPRADQELVWLRLWLSAGQSEELAQRLAADRAGVAATLDGLVQLLDVPPPQRAGAATELHILVEGLTWAVCTRRVPPEETAALVERFIDRLTDG